MEDPTGRRRGTDFDMIPTNTPPHAATVPPDLATRRAHGRDFARAGERGFRPKVGICWISRGSAAVIHFSRERSADTLEGVGPAWHPAAGPGHVAGEAAELPL